MSAGIAARGNGSADGQRYHHGRAAGQICQQAQYQAGGDHWNRWFPRIRDQLLNDQQKDGSWSDLTFSNEYATAMSCIILQIPNNHLPIFKR